MGLVGVVVVAILAWIVGFWMGDSESDGYDADESGSPNDFGGEDGD